MIQQWGLGTISLTKAHKKLGDTTAGIFKGTESN